MIDRARLDAALREAEPGELFAIAGEIQGRAFAQMTQQKPPASQVGRRVSVAVAAKALGCSPGWLYHNKELPFVRRLGRRVVIDLAAAEAYMDAGYGEG